MHPAHPAPRVRHMRGTATVVAHITWDVWHCHGSRAYHVGCVALPLFSHIRRGMCGTATVLARITWGAWQCHGSRESRALPKHLGSALELVDNRDPLRAGLLARAALDARTRQRPARAFVEPFLHMATE